MDVTSSDMNIINSDNNTIIIKIKDDVDHISTSNISKIRGFLKFIFGYTKNDSYSFINSDTSESRDFAGMLCLFGGMLTFTMIILLSTFYPKISLIVVMSAIVIIFVVLTVYVMIVAPWNKYMEYRKKYKVTNANI